MARLTITPPASTLRSAAPGVLLLLVLVAALGPASSQPYGLVTKFLTVPVDQFSFTKNETFQVRYLVNDTWWDKNKPGPIFLYTGNEGDINFFAQNTGFMWDIAPEFRAMLVFVEHRYYGKSMPFGQNSYSDPQRLGYLNANQAMADFVDVINELRREQRYPRLSPVIVFGGSYGGMLSAWMRMKYPHVVAGAISGSAPILMSAGITPCDAFSRIVTSVYHHESPACSENIRNSWAAIRNITKTDEGKAWISKEFSLRNAVHSNEGVQTLIDWLGEAFVNVAVANYPYPANFLGDMPAFPVREVCRSLQSRLTDERSLSKAIYGGVSVYFNYTGSAKSLDVNNSDSDLGEKGWDFQACTEMAMPTCSGGQDDMFEKTTWNEVAYSNGCFARWKVRPVYNMTGWEFGARDLRGASNIVFSNGLLDPWAAGGVVRNISASVVAVLIPEGAHHLDLRSRNPADPFSVRSARRVHRTHIKRWIKEHWRCAHAELAATSAWAAQDNHLQTLAQPAVPLPQQR